MNMISGLNAIFQEVILQGKANQLILEGGRERKHIENASSLSDVAIYEQIRNDVLAGQLSSTDNSLTYDFFHEEYKLNRK